MLATNSSLFPVSVLKCASTHVQAGLPSGLEPSGPKPSCACSDGAGPGLLVSPSIHTWPYALSVRSTTLIVCVMEGGHWRFDQPIVRWGSALTSFESPLSFPAA